MCAQRRLRIARASVLSVFIVRMKKAWVLSYPITKTCLYNVDPLKPHFYIVKVRFTGVYIIFLISAQNIDYGYSLEPPRRGGSNEYPQSVFLSRKKKNIRIFIWKFSFFLVVKFSVYLSRLVFRNALSAQRRLWLDWADAQTDLSPHWAHIHIYWFCHEVAELFSSKGSKWTGFSWMFMIVDYGVIYVAILYLVIYLFHIQICILY